MPQALTVSIKLVLLSVSLKLLLFPSAHSTDLEVHRHWKALTTSLPLSEWYTEESSVWTLDYPPAFAYLEYILGRAIGPIHRPLVNISNHNDDSRRTVRLLRGSVLLLDPVLAFSITKFINAYRSPSGCYARIFSASSDFPLFLALLNPALIIVDSIHFQYNALLIALLFLSIEALCTSFTPLAAAIFTVAVNTKHTIFLLSLPLVIYVLSTLHRSDRPFSLIIRTVLSTACTLSVLWLPFVLTGGMQLLIQIKERLLPFDRGLLHANWGPNFWAFYAVADKMLSMFGFDVRSPDVNITSGHIGALRPFACLPNPSPTICLCLSVVAAIPPIVCMVRQPSHSSLLRAIIVTALGAFIFGWHVHEKSLLVALIPLSVLASVASQVHKSSADAVSFLILSLSTSLSVGDLVAQRQGMLFSWIFGAFYFLLSFSSLRRSIRNREQNLILLYAFGCAAVEVYSNGGGHSFLFGKRLPFAPKMLVSIYSFIGVAFSYIMLNAAAREDIED